MVLDDRKMDLLEFRPGDVGCKVLNLLQRSPLKQLQHFHVTPSSQTFSHALNKLTLAVSQILFLFIFLLFINLSNTLECNVPSSSPLTLTFNDLLQRDVIFSKCLTAPVEGRKFLHLSVEYLSLPSGAQLMIYTDGESLLLDHSCLMECSNQPSTNAAAASYDLLADVRNLQLSLEKEIIDSEIFLASNEKIEERSKRSDLKFEVNVDRKNIEKMARLKEFASGKHSTKALDIIKKPGDCTVCPSFKDHKLIELHLRLPRNLDCLNNTDVCLGRPELIMKIELIEKPLECSDSVMAVWPLSNLDAACRYSSESLPAPSCLVTSCHPSEILVPKSDGIKEHLRHEASSKKISVKNKRRAKNLKRMLETSSAFVEKFEIVLIPSESHKVCFWKLDTTFRKNLELIIPLIILPHINVFDGSLLAPRWNVEFCPVSNSSSYWLQASGDEVYIVYSNPYPLEEETTIVVHLHTGPCEPPNLVAHAQMSWTSSSSGGRAVYVCDELFSMHGAAEVMCDDRGSWGPLPSCHSQYKNKSTSVSDEPDSTAASPTHDGAMWLLANGSLHSERNNKSAGYSAGESSDFVYSPADGALDGNEPFMLEPSRSAPHDGTQSGDYDEEEEEEEEDGKVDGGDNYDYNETEYDYLPEYNTTTKNLTSLINGSVVTLIPNRSSDAWGNSSFTDDITDVRSLLKALSIDENKLIYFLAGCCGLLLLIVLLSVVTCFLMRRRRHPARVVRKFDTFQNPIYEKTVVNVPLEGDFTEDEDEKRPPSTPPLALKAEMEDLSDSTVMEQ
ncbi:uncharacterized protein LOC108679344 [Hyalella azteca]|uniref:Uncharacterized protein LOC108679344 n=1 Tax=Hyalella azteca TaxID=294128 RepID=A0A8B7PCN2_HYAAZ|nr:uncharacterized protein LOC108679344 [Hyalella azteca]